MICFCAVHCTLNTYHEKACCERGACECLCHGKIKLFLDDERPTPDGWFRTYTVEQTIYWLRSKRVSHLSLDNDLGEGKQEGYKVMDFIEETMHYDPLFPLPEITIHSANAARAEYMRRVINKLELAK